MNKTFYQISALFACFTLCFGCGTNSTKQAKENATRETKLVGSDRDEHGCIASAGYQWSELLQDCIRPFEKGCRMKQAEGEGTQAAYLVFNNDSSKVELFLPKNKVHPILLRTKTDDGHIIWKGSAETQFTVRCIENNWQIYTQNNLLYIKD